MAILSLRDIGFGAAGQRILQGIGFDVAEGEFVALLGPSGCGKSTLLRQIAGFERPRAGTIMLDGRIVAGPDAYVPPEDREVGMVFQSYALWPHMDVAGNVGYSLRVRRMPGAERAARVAEALATVGLSGFEARKVQSLSGGQRQRVALARCLAMRPRLLLLDEPLANLDAHLRETMVEEFRHLHRSTGATILYVTHDQAEALAMADRIAVMSKGSILQMDTPDKVWREPATAEVARFLGRGEVVGIEVLEPGPPARVRLFGETLSLRGPAGLQRGPAQACLRRETLALGDQGVPVKVISSRVIGARQMVTVSPCAAPDLRLVVETEPRPLGDSPRLIIADGWILQG